MAGSSARRWRWTTAIALGLIACCALIQTGCLRPPTTAADTLSQQLYNIQPGVPVAGAPGPIAPGPLDGTAIAPPAAAAPSIATAPPIAIAPPAAAPIAVAPTPAAGPSLLLSPGVVVAQV